MFTRPGELGELQFAVMNILWGCTQATVHQVQAAFPEERKPAYTTVLTVLRNLEKRGLVTHYAPEGSRMYFYSAVVSAEDTRGDILQDIVNRFFEGSPVQLFSQLMRSYLLTSEEIREIQKILKAPKSGG